MAIHSTDDAPQIERGSVSRTLRSVIVANLIIGFVPTTIAFLTSGQFDRLSFQRWGVGVGVGVLTVVGNWAQRLREQLTIGAHPATGQSGDDYTRVVTRDTARLHRRQEARARRRFE